MSWQATLSVFYRKAHKRGDAVFAGTTTLTAEGAIMRKGRAVFSGVSAFAASALRRLRGSATFSGSTTFTANGSINHQSYYHLLVAGQSVSTGVNSSPVVSTSQPANNKMFAGPHGVNATSADLISPSLVPLVATDDVSLGQGETIANGCADTLSQAAPRVFVVSGHGVSGYQYSQLKKGTAPYALGLAQVSAAKTLLPSARYCGVPAIAILHGEADQSFAVPNYDAKLAEWQSDYNTDVKAITGQTTDIPIFVYQIAYGLSGCSATPTSPGISAALASLKAYEAAPANVVLVGPNYPYPRADGIHLTAHGERQMALIYARAIKRVTVDGLPWVPLMPISIVRSGAIIDVTFAVPTPPLVLDVQRIVNPGNLDTTQPYGFKYIDDTNSAQITSVVLRGANSLRITLNTTPTGTNKGLAYAWSTTDSTSKQTVIGGPRGCLRDSAADANPYGYDSFNWCVSFYKPIT